MNTILPVMDTMQASGHGHIAIMSSLSAYRGIPAFPAYSASKAALFSYCEAVRGKLALHGVELSVICPGYVETDMTAQLSGMKLLVLPVDKAAAIIKAGLEKRKTLIVFPALLRLGLWLSGILPVRLNTQLYNTLFGIRKDG